MVALTPQEKQVIDLFQQLPADRQRYVMLEMFRTDPDRWSAHQKEGEQALRNHASKRGLDWDKLDEDQRQDFVEELLREEKA
jgi:hypothetical protein